jgi:hypothetical protein
MQTLSPTETKRAAIDANDVRFQTGVNASFHEGEQRMRSMELALEANTKKTNELYDKTAEMVEVFTAMKGGFKVLEYLATIAKVIAAIGAAAIFIAKMAGWNWPGSK